ncbi:hypothetical protein ACUR5C_10105 [Aliikangiella sp. IMCC44653]
MAKPVLIGLHGMGNHTADSFKQEITQTLDQASPNFKAFFKDANGNTEPFSQKVEVVCIAYNQTFNQIRQKISQNAGSLKSKLVGIDKATEIANKLIELEADFGEDTFFNTHWLDVILYKTFYGEKIRADMALALAKEIKRIKLNDPTTPIVLLGHSLGTAVLHDTLHKLFGPGATGNRKLSIAEYQLDAVIMVANVSRLVLGAKDPYLSLVKPVGGVCNQLINIRHNLDPFTWPRAFDPVNDMPDWIASQNLDFGLFRDIKLAAVNDFNTHAITHYLQNPKVYIDLFYTLFGGDFRPTKKQKDTAFKNFLETTEQTKFDILKQTLDATSFKKADSVERIISEAEKFWKFLQAFQTNNH